MKIIAGLLALLNSLVSLWQSHQRKATQKERKGAHDQINSDPDAALRERDWMREDGAPADYVPKSTGTLSEEYSARLHDKQE